MNTAPKMVTREIVLKLRWKICGTELPSDGPGATPSSLGRQNCGTGGPGSGGGECTGSGGGAIGSSGSLPGPGGTSSGRGGGSGLSGGRGGRTGSGMAGPEQVENVFGAAGSRLRASGVPKVGANRPPALPRDRVGFFPRS